MTEKIEWYREVLELEPNSKVFFSLARLLAGEHENDEAIAVLTRGLERHPEFLEARLFLIELLHAAGRKEQCDKQIEKLESMFSSYAGFWQAWAACIENDGKDADTASILRFMAARFLAGPIQIHDILNRGIESILHSRISAQATEVAQIPSTSTAHNASDEIASGKDSGTVTEQVNVVAANIAEPTAVAEREEEAGPVAMANTPAVDENQLREPSDVIETLDTVLTKSEVPEDAQVDKESPKQETPLQASSVQETGLPESLEKNSGQGELDSEATSSEAGEVSMAHADDMTAENLANDKNVVEEMMEAISAFAEEETRHSPQADQASATDNVMESEAPDNLSESESETGTETETQQAVPTEDIPAETIEATYAADSTTESDAEIQKESADAASSLVESLEQTLNQERSLPVSEANQPGLTADSTDIYEPEETFTLRTRSMADVLAEQGDIQGALDIYNELAAAASSPAEANEISARITDLSSQIGTVKPIHDELEREDAVNPESRDKLVGILKTLARMVEARAQN